MLSSYDIERPSPDPDPKCWKYHLHQITDDTSPTGTTETGFTRQLTCSCGFTIIPGICDTPEETLQYAWVIYCLHILLPQSPPAS